MQLIHSTKLVAFLGPRCGRIPARAMNTAGSIRKGRWSAVWERGADGGCPGTCTQRPFKGDCAGVRPSVHRSPGALLDSALTMFCSKLQNVSWKPAPLGWAGRHAFTRSLQSGRETDGAGGGPSGEGGAGPRRLLTASCPSGVIRLWGASPHALTEGGGSCPLCHAAEPPSDCCSDDTGICLEGIFV